MKNIKQKIYFLRVFVYCLAIVAFLMSFGSFASAETYTGSLPSSQSVPTCYVGTPQGDMSSGCPKDSRLKKGKCYSTQQRGDNYLVTELDCSTQGSVDSSQSFTVPTSAGVSPVNDAQLTANGIPTAQERAAASDCTNPDNAGQARCSLTQSIIVPLVNILSIAVGLVVVLSIVIAGIMYITSNGNPQQVATAKSRIFNSIIALVVYIFGFALLQWLVPGGIFHK